MDYKKYRWFITSSGKLVVGGKSAEQNDQLLISLKKKNKNFIVMHTSHPGSPFSVIFDDAVGRNDLDECTVFTGCFSRAWKEEKKKTRVHIFRASQLEKTSEMKVGTWRVRGKIKEKDAMLKLVITKQRGVYRAVPFGKGIVVVPGKVDKKEMIEKLRKKLKDTKAGDDELLSALPAGGMRIE